MKVFRHLLQRILSLKCKTSGNIFREKYCPFIPISHSLLAYVFNYCACSTQSNGRNYVLIVFHDLFFNIRFKVKVKSIFYVIY
jgi:hypothetical protein